MPRTFNGSTEDITVSTGAVLKWGGVTFAAIVKRASLGRFDAIFNGDGSGADSTAWYAYINTSNLMTVWNGAADTSSAYTVPAGEWAFVAVSKATGSNTARFHKYLYASNAWTHENSPGGASADSPITPLQLKIGHAASGGIYFSGDIAVVGIIGGILADQQVEALPFSLAAWWQISPTGLWLLDQSATTIKTRDQSGGGANEFAIVGTTVATASVPVFGYGGQAVVETLAIPVPVIGQPDGRRTSFGPF